MVTTKVDMPHILNSMRTHILLLDREFNITYVNASVQQLLKQMPKKLYGHYLFDMFSYSSLNLAVMKRNLNQGKQFIDNELHLKIDENRFIMSFSAQPVDDNTILIEMIGLNNQQKFSQEKIQQSQQTAARELIRGLAHEIKNPLSGLRGAAQLLSRELVADELKEYTKIIIQQADRLRNLVDRLLGPQRPSLQQAQNIYHTLERVGALLKLEKNDNIEIVRDYDPSLPDLVHDAEQIEQVILNIVRNALQAIGNNSGTIILRTRTDYQVTLHGVSYRLCARIDIEDNGPGVPMHLQDILFYPMVSGREGGNGLGLSIARNLIDQHKGKIELNSWPGHTVFSIYLPIRQ